MNAWWRKKQDTDTGYRGVDSPEATTARQLAGRLRDRPLRPLHRMEIPREHRPPLLPGRDSRRPRQNVWVRA